ncbi:UNVERIFIED_CONTAM: Dihydroflavonol 4-reductase [Sesamum radiatum]|uniref:Dihydroflavonol 4-reductase n=1 Tax=Sesamum radiatum TaxID=300843 RepID=A0AAW2RGS8_SESRA
MGVETTATPPPATTTVCVTGAAGFIGSWLVMRLLERGYTVRATVRDPGNMKKVKHLTELPKADTNLTLWKADMNIEGSFDEAIQGCEGVFHLATPMDFESNDPENEVIKPTVEGMLSIIRSCAKAKTVKKIIFTNSAGTLNVEEHQKPVYDESNWSDLDFINSKKMTGWMYFVSKILAEKAAMEAAKENNINFISIIPPVVVGPFTMPTFPPSLITALSDYRFEGIDKDIPVVSFSSKKLIEIGFTFNYTLEDMFREAIETCREKGLLPYSTQIHKNGEEKEPILNSLTKNQEKDTLPTSKEEHAEGQENGLLSDTA